MIGDFIVDDLPPSPTAAVSDDISLGVVRDVLEASGCEAAVVTRADGRLHGILLRDTIDRVASRAPDAAIGQLTPLRVMEVSPAMTLTQAMLAFNEPSVAAMVVQAGTSWKVVLREALLGITSWEPLQRARDARLALPTA